MILTQLALGLYLPALPTIVRSWHTSATLVQLSYTLFLVGLGVYIFAYGYLTQLFNYKRLFIIGNVLFTAITITMLLSHNIYLFSSLRFLQGVAAGVGSISIATAMLRNIYQPRMFQKIFSYVVTISMLGSMMTPLLGSYIQKLFNWNGIFIFLLLISIFLIFLTYYLFPSIKNKKDERSYFEGFITNLKNISFSSNIIYATLLSSMTTAYMIASPFLFEIHFGLSPVLYGWTFALLQIIFMLGAYFNSIIIIRLQFKKVFKFGLVLNVIGLSLLLINTYVLPHSLILFIIAIGILLFGTACLYPNFVSQAFISPNLSVVAGATIFGLFQIVGFSIATFLMAILEETTLAPLSWVLFVFNLLIIVLVLIFNPDYFVDTNH